MKEEKIMIAGFGGQGIILAGNVIAQAALAENKKVAAMVSYGAEVRGGTATCTVIISDEEIASPVVENPTSAIILNQPSLDKFEDDLVKGGLIVLNSSLVQREVIRKDLEVLKVPATGLANELGNPKVANLILIGAFIKKTKILDINKVLEIIPQSFPKHKQDVVEINKKALLKGAELV
ncbi:MAG: 2-oxoacid:acceptor oxidoreductase family protein [Nanoarchaeota archaeon]|nr:2-oxoacid:acceptor oxidoreductase family protein [Nanoarchaeota archaeon]MBU1004309.1 2-oxoacid:acceptor oxidoreductase family protein [Nanoarchaeota archaeon]MBU1945473.1 2-oxoacid:acceptor oxidoreductase family protein [Nanoarchaeota archaeon]